MGDFDLGLLDDETYKKELLRTKMLGIAEVFMYRLPSGKSSPYRAEDWPLTKPLQCVSLLVERRGNALLLIFTYQQDGQTKSKLFALCTVDLVAENTDMEHYVEPVVDSTRYFVVRVKDERAGREALIGLGFREREESADFRATLEKYESDIAKEKTARAMQMAQN